MGSTKSDFTKEMTKLAPVSKMTEKLLVERYIKSTGDMEAAINSVELRVDGGVQPLGVTSYKV